MAYLKDVDIAFRDSPSIDAFGRARVSQVTSQLDLKQIHDDLPLFYDVEEIGTGSQSYTATNSSSTLTTAANSDAAIMQTKSFGNYQSGKSQQVFITFSNFGNETNITKRIGCFTNTNFTTPFDSNKDGLYLETDGTTRRVVIANGNGTLTQVSQASWNIDTLDGNGPSGITVDWALTQILVIDYEWLGVGRVRFGLVIDGLFYYFHEFLNSNVGTGVYMLSPNQPIRAEIRQTGAGSGSLVLICATIGTEGSLNSLGKVLSANNGTSQLNANSTGTRYAAVGLRLQQAKADTLIDLINFSLLGTTNDNFLWEVYLNPTVRNLTSNILN